MNDAPHKPANAQVGMPKWLLYGLIGKGILVVVIVIAVMWYAGVF